MDEDCMFVRSKKRASSGSETEIESEKKKKKSSVEVEENLYPLFDDVNRIYLLERTEPVRINHSEEECADKVAVNEDNDFSVYHESFSLPQQSKNPEGIVNIAEESFSTPNGVDLVSNSVGLRKRQSIQRNQTWNRKTSPLKQKPVSNPINNNNMQTQSTQYNAEESPWKNRTIIFLLALCSILIFLCINLVTKNWELKTKLETIKGSIAPPQELPTTLSCPSLLNSGDILVSEKILLKWAINEIDGVTLQIINERTLILSKNLTVSSFEFSVDKPGEYVVLLNPFKGSFYYSECQPFILKARVKLAVVFGVSAEAYKQSVLSELNKSHTDVEYHEISLNSQSFPKNILYVDVIVKRVDAICEPKFERFKANGVEKISLLVLRPGKVKFEPIAKGSQVQHQYEALIDYEGPSVLLHAGDISFRKELQEFSV